MSILIDEKKKVIIQGITGREGQARAKLMMGYGTKVIAGCTPGKGGQETLGVPVYDTVLEAVEKHGNIDVSVIFVPAPIVKDAAIEAIEAGVKLCVIVPDRVPIYDVMEIKRIADRHGANFIGPNTLGTISPGKAVLGMMGGRAESARKWFKTGHVGVSSRSGGMTSSLAYYLSQAGIGLSTIVHVGGDPIIGMPHYRVCLEFEKDPDTHAIVLFGEIGGSQEEKVAELMREGKITKPVIAYIGGKAAKEGVRFSHAGAIVEGGRGTHAGKVKALRDAGAVVVEDFADIPSAVNKIL
jgi:succinyl-CoA synthetase alpha subunit